MDDLTLLVDLVSSGWRGVDARLERLEAAAAEEYAPPGRVEDLTHGESLEHAAAA